MAYTPDVPEITVQELKSMMDGATKPFILDVREAYEYDIANLEGTLIPLQELPQRVDELEDHRDEMIVVHCRTGGRSAQAVQYLQAMGYDQAVNLKGGVIAWSQEIDPTLPTY